jgi:hypothetical protein
MIFSTTAFKHFIATDAAWESKFNREPCLDVSMPEIVRLSFSTSRKSLPMGVNCRVYYLVFIIDDELEFSLL